MITNLNPGIVFIEGKFINMENIVDYTVNKDNLFILLDYYSNKEILKFGSTQELNRAVRKLEDARRSLDYGVNYG